MLVGLDSKERWPLYVCSKGRAGASKLLEGLNAAGWKRVTVVVEPQDAKAYSEAYPALALLVLEKNDQGLYYARVAQYAATQHKKLGWYWLLDDDITAFVRVDGKRCVHCSLVEALMGAQACAVEGVGQIALEYGQFAWSCGGRVRFNSYADVCVAMNSELLTARGVGYREPFIGLGLKGDRDFTMQVIQSGLNVARCTRYGFNCPKNGSNKGGLQATYGYGDKSNREAQASAVLAAIWPWCAEVKVKPDGRVDAKIHWNKVRE